MAECNDKKLKFDCVFLDFKNAFDRVDHQSLLNAFEGIADRPAVDWLRSFLSERKLSVRLEGQCSEAKVLTCGVPQGSHLAPTLFLLFVNSLPSSITYCTPYLFADDVTLLYVHDNKNSLQGNQSRLESDLSACQVWASNVGGEFSPAKTTQIRNYSNDHPIQLSSQPITIVEAAKHLGVYFTPDQSNTIHLQTILKTFQRRVNLLCFMRRHLALTAFLLLHVYTGKGFVRPALEYAS